ncbi:MAG: hypothetical protein II870_07105 [Synergistaceae bacterium]|nr:hypothetical protein [Synergistaceae bacterium]
MKTYKHWRPFWSKPEWLERQRRREAERAQVKIQVPIWPAVPEPTEPKAALLCTERIGGLEIRFYESGAKSTFLSKLLIKMLRWQ